MDHVSRSAAAMGRRAARMAGKRRAEDDGPDHRADEERAMTLAYLRSLNANSFVSVRT